MISLQTIIVLLIVGFAAAYFGVTMIRKARSFKADSDCGDNCGCNGSAKKLHS